MDMNEQNNAPSEYPKDTGDVPTHKTSGFFAEVIKFLILAVIIVVPIRLYVASPFLVSGASMDPTFATGHYLIVDQISYRFSEPKRGEIIIFRYPNDTSKFFIKRIIGLPGETVEIKEGVVTVVAKDGIVASTLQEPYIEFQKYDTLVTTLSDTEYFVMGDNRKASSDSRIWGPLDEEFITGRAFIRLFPIIQVDLFPGKSQY